LQSYTKQKRKKTQLIIFKDILCINSLLAVAFCHLLVKHHRKIEGVGVRNVGKLSILNLVYSNQYAGVVVHS